MGVGELVPCLPPAPPVWGRHYTTVEEGGGLGWGVQKQEGGFSRWWWVEEEQVSRGMIGGAEGQLPPTHLLCYISKYKGTSTLQR